MKELTTTLLEHLSQAETWLAAQSAWATIFAWLAVLVAYLYRSGYMALLKKQLRKYDELFADQAEQFAAANKTLSKSSANDKEMRIQLKRERELKGQYKNQLDEAIKNMNKAA
jgi:flagellar biosynthesis/type III secretory pathway M-ring protein FliF/YscJ